MASIPPNLTVAELNKLQPGHLTGAQKSRVARLLSNPATRHLLADRFLTPVQQQTRKTNAFNAAPVVPGSTVTNKDLASQRAAAAALKYGGAETQAGRDIASRQTAVGQTAGYFDQYLADLRSHEANQAQINAQSQAAMQGLTGSVQGLGQQAGQVVAQGNQGTQAALGMAPASITQDASNASMIRQALTASLGAMLTGQGASAQSYADTLAHVVGPGQKLQGVTRAQGDVTKAQQARSDLAKEKGAFEQQFENEFKTNEAKNVLAGQIAQVNTDQKQQQIDIQKGNQKIAARALDANTQDKKARVQETGKARRSRERIANARNKAAAKTAKDKADLAAGKVNQYGYTDAAWRTMSTAERQKVIKDFKGSGRGSGSGKGPQWVTQNEMGAAMTQLTGLKQAANAAKTGKAFVPGHAPQSPLDRHQAAAKILSFPAIASKLKNPVLVTAALDAAYDGHLSRVTVRKLIAAGYKPSQVASALGVPTAANYRPPAPQSPGQVVPGIGPTV